MGLLCQTGPLREAGNRCKDSAARAFGTQVIWVNLPTKRSDATK